MSLSSFFKANTVFMLLGFFVFGWLLLFNPWQSHAASTITLDATSQTFTTGQSTTSWTHTTTSQPNTILIVSVELQSSDQNTAVRTVASITYNNQSLTRFTSFVNWYSEDEVWYLPNPPSGTHQIVVTVNGYNSGTAAGAATYYNVNTATPFSSLTTNKGFSQTPSISVSSNTNQVVMDTVFSTADEQDSVFTANSSQTQLWFSGNITNGGVLGGSSKPGQSGSTALSWMNAKPAYNWGEIGFALNPAPAPTNTPTPTPTAIPTPTSTPSLYSISGNLYTDRNGNQHYNPPAETFTSGNNGTITITNSIGNTVATLPNITNAYTTGAVLPSGDYTVSYSSLPSGYYLSYPVNGPPPSFTVTIGSPCNTYGIHDAACSSGNISNLNVGLTNALPWFQATCGDMRIDSGIADPIPQNPVCGSVSGAYAIQSNATCANTPGVAFSGDNTYSFGQGQASANPYNWTVGGLTYPDVFKSATPTVIRTSYAYMTATARQSGITPLDVSSACTLPSCTLPASLPHGLYQANGTVYLNGYTFPSNQNYVFLINGDLYIQGTIAVPQGSTATFSVSGNIYVDKSVGVAATSTTSNLDGFYSTDKSFIVNTTGSCSDQRLNISGSVVTNAALQGGSFQNKRSLCGTNATCPTVTFTQRPDLLLNAPLFIKHADHLWQEVAP